MNAMSCIAWKSVRLSRFWFSLMHLSQMFLQFTVTILTQVFRRNIRNVSKRISSVLGAVRGSTGIHRFGKIRVIHIYCRTQFLQKERGKDPLEGILTLGDSNPFPSLG